MQYLDPPSFYTKDDSDRIVGTFFWTVYTQGRFLFALEQVTLKYGHGHNEEGCTFPDWDSVPELHFDGVIFYTFQEETLISEQRCTEHIDAVCAEYLVSHPADTGKVREILRKRLI